MNFFQAQDFFKKLYPGKNIFFEFDDKCHRFHELVFTDGKPHSLHHIECDKVKVTVEGNVPIYVDIVPHRFNLEWEEIKKIINSKNEIHTQ